MFLGNLRHAFPAQRVEGGDKALTRLLRQDYIVKVTALRRYKRIHHSLGIFVNLLFTFFFRIVGVANLTRENNIRGALRTHDSNFRSGPAEHDVAAEML